MRMRKSLFALLLVSPVFFWGGLAQGSVYVADSFLTGVNSGAGEYTTGGLYGQAPYSEPFYSSWYGGLTTTDTSAFQVVSTGLTYPDLYNQTGGSIQYTGSSSTVGTGAQALLREFTAISPVAGNNYYMSGLMSFDASFASSPTAKAYTGWLNAEQGDSSVAYTIGTQWGFQVNETGGVDAVILHRQWTGEGVLDVVPEVLATNIAPGTYSFAIHMSPDYGSSGGSSDLIAAWCNPNTAMDEYAGPNPQVVNYNTASWLLPSGGDATRLVDSLVLTATDVPAGSVVSYDEVRFGDTWEEVVAAPGTTQEIVKHPLCPVTLASGKDGYEMTAVELRKNYTTGPLGSKDEMLVGGISSSQSAVHPYMEFDLSGIVIPEGLDIASISLQTTVKRTDIRGAGVGDIELRLANPTATVVEMEANWTNANATTPWNISGGDPTETILGVVNGDGLAAGNKVTFSSQELLDAVNAALTGDGLLKMTMMSPFAEGRAASYNERNFVGFYTDDSNYVPTLKFNFAGPQQAAPTGEQIAFTPEVGDGVVAATIAAGPADANYGESQIVVVGGANYGNLYERYRTVASIPVSEEMIPEGKEVIGVSLQLTVDRVEVEGAGLGEIELRLANGSGIVETEVSWNSMSGTEETGLVAWSEAGGSPGALLSTLDADYAMTVGYNVWFESTEALLAAFNDALATDGTLDLMLMSSFAEEYQGINNYIIFGSDDNEDVAYRPQLILQLADAQAVYTPGDANKDGKVDGSDVTILAGNWQVLTGANWSMGDFNGDGKVDGSDVTILAGNWQAGVNSAAASVPEPGTIVLVLSALAGLMLVRRKK